MTLIQNRNVKQCYLHRETIKKKNPLTLGPESDAPTPPTTPRATPSDQQAVRRQAAEVRPACVMRVVVREFKLV